MIEPKLMSLLVRHPDRLTGDIGLPLQIQKDLVQQEGVWATCPYSRTKLLIKELNDVFYVVDDTEAYPSIIEMLAIEIGEKLVQKGYINVLNATDLRGAVKIDVRFGIPNLIWMKNPRGKLDAARSGLCLRILSAITAPLFFVVDPFVKMWQHKVYIKVYEDALSRFPEYYKQISRGMSHPKLFLKRKA